MDFDKPCSSLRSLSNSRITQRNTKIKRTYKDSTRKLRKPKGSTEKQDGKVATTNSSDKIETLKKEEWADKCRERVFKRKSACSASQPQLPITTRQNYEKKVETRLQVNSKSNIDKESEMNNCRMKNKSLVTGKSGVTEQIPKILLAKRMKLDVSEEIVKPLTSSESKSFEAKTVSKLILAKNEESYVKKVLNEVKPVMPDISHAKTVARRTTTPKTKTERMSITDLSPELSRVIQEINERNKIINCSNPFKERIRHSRYKSIRESHSDKNVYHIDEFVILKSDKDKIYPPIWKICSPSALEKFCPVYRQGRFRYHSLNEFKNCLGDDVNDYERAPGSIWWRSHPKQIIEFKRNDIVVREEDIREKTYNTNKKYMYNFLIYIQTLVSQALIPKFTIEVYLHQDKYFSPAEVIIDINEKYKDKFLHLTDWNNTLKDMLKLRPVLLNVVDVMTYDRLCVACGRLEATVEIILGNHNKWLSTKRKGKASILPKAYPLCAMCAWSFDLWKELSYFTHTMFFICVKKVCEKSMNTYLTEVEKLVKEILNDETWCDVLFRSACRVWAKVDILEVQKCKLKEFLK